MSSFLGGGKKLTPGAPNNSVQFNNGGSFGGDQNLEWIAGTGLQIGSVSGALTGDINFQGKTSGVVGLSVQDAAGTWNLKLPTNAGSLGQGLVTDGTGISTWQYLGLGSIPANGNQAFTVDPTGSDSNPGTPGAPFATFQHAANIGTKYDYQGQYTLAITVNAGTFAPSTQVNLSELVNYPSNLFASINGAGVGSTTLRPGSGIGFVAVGSTSVWQINNLTVDVANYAFISAAGAFTIFPNGGHIAVKDSSNGSGPRIFVPSNGIINCLSSVDISTLTALSAFCYILGDNPSSFVFNVGGITFPASNIGGGWLLTNFNYYANVSWIPGTITNRASWDTTGGVINIEAGTIIATTDGTLGPIPGNQAFNVFDKTCIINNLNTESTRFLTDLNNTPSTLASGTTNNYVLIEPNYFQRITANAANSVLTGLKWNVGQQGRDKSEGDSHLLVNVGTGTLTLNHQDAGSTKTNRFNNSTGAAIVLNQNQAADLYYDAQAANGTDNTGAWLVFKRN